MNDGWVKSVNEERDLGVLISKDLNFSKQCLLPKNKVNIMFDIINRKISYKSAEVISKLYRSYFRLHLLVLYSVLTPINEKDADMLEGVPRGATKVALSLRKLSYDERLKKLGMFSRRRKSIWGD